MKKEHLIPIGKGKKVIYLDKRGKTNKGLFFAACFFKLMGILCLLYCISIAFFMGYGTSFFLIWGGLAAICLGLACIMARESLVKRIPGWLRRSFVVCLTIGMVLFLTVEGMIISCFGATAQENADYLIVLGAQWKESGPSYVLKKRLDKALDYLNENPDTKVIVSGGQGGNEHISEAQGMYGYLVNAGIGEERLIMEDKSTNTCENLAFSSEYLNKEEDHVVLVTNNFHVFRATGIAKAQGYEQVEGLAAGSYPGMLPNNLLREFFGVVKDFLVGNL